jgi:hypothetical protein
MRLLRLHNRVDSHFCVCRAPRRADPIEMRREPVTLAADTGL